MLEFELKAMTNFEKMDHFLKKYLFEIFQQANFKELKWTNCSQFHQHFTYKFFVWTLFQQIFSSYMYIEKAAETMFVRKICTWNVDDMDKLIKSSSFWFNNSLSNTFNDATLIDQFKILISEKKTKKSSS